MTVAFALDGQEFIALNGGPRFRFTEAISFGVRGGQHGLGRRGGPGRDSRPGSPPPVSRAGPRTVGNPVQTPNAFRERMSPRLDTIRASSLPGMLTITPSGPRPTRAREPRSPKP